MSCNVLNTSTTTKFKEPLQKHFFDLVWTPKSMDCVHWWKSVELYLPWIKVISYIAKYTLLIYFVHLYSVYLNAVDVATIQTQYLKMVLKFAILKW